MLSQYVDEYRIRYVCFQCLGLVLLQWNELSYKNFLTNNLSESVIYNFSEVEVFCC